MKTLSKALVAALLAIVALTGCGGGQPLTYVPSAYGQNGQCYYVDDPSEAIALQQAGLCGPVGNYWVPTIMPLFWHEQYYAYYSSGAYYNRYVPVASRTVYVQHTTVFYNSNKTAIASAEKTASYKGSNGKTYTGNKVKSGSFGNGTKSFGNGKKCSLGFPNGIVLTKGGGGGGHSGGGSHSGGSSKGGGSKSFGNGNKGSTSGGSSGSKSKGGC